MRRSRFVEAGLQTRLQQTTPDAMVAQERAEQLWRAIDALPDKLRIAIVLAGIEGHDIREVALVARRAGRHGEVSALSGPQAVEGTVVMDGHRHADPLTDESSLDREIESMMAVEPSPQFVARVRARVAQEPEPGRWRASWLFAPAGAVAIVIVAVIAWPSGWSRCRRVLRRSDCPPSRGSGGAACASGSRSRAPAGRAACQRRRFDAREAANADSNDLCR